MLDLDMRNPIYKHAFGNNEVSIYLLIERADLASKEHLLFSQSATMVHVIHPVGSLVT